MMKEEFIYCHLYWVDALKMRLWCKDHDIGTIRGITVDEYQQLKPKVEALTVKDFAQMKKRWPHLTGPSKEDIEHDIEELKQRFREFEQHPELLGKDTESITYKDEDWWRPAKPTDRPLFIRHRENLFGKIWEWQDGTIPIPEHLKIDDYMRNFRENYIHEDLTLLKEKVKHDPVTEIAMAMLKHEPLPIRKTIRIEAELEYPSCDFYPTPEIMEFLEESFLEWMNANLSDGDNRLKMAKLSVTSEGITMTKK